MQILKRIGIILVWLAGPVFIFAAVNKNDPYLISLRGPGNIVLAAVSIIAVVVLIRRGYWRRGAARRALILLWCLPSLSMLGAHASFEWRKRNVLQTETGLARSLGRHFIVGYSSFPEVAALAEKGLISGVYVTRHNVAGSSSARLKEEILALQEKRRAAGLPPLIVAADQEGGIVSHLAPPLTKLPALSTLAGLAPDVRAEKAEAFGRTHGQELAALGELEASDWIPFRNVLAGSKAQLMIGHVTLTSVDPDRPASHSKRVVNGIVRKKWNYQGVVMTDDLVMGRSINAMSVRQWSR